MENIEELQALAILTATPLLGSVKIRMLLKNFGSPSSVLSAAREEIALLQGIPLRTLDAWGWWRKDHSWKRNLELAEKQGVRLVSFTSPEYPKRLTHLPDFPILLYIKGRITESDTRSLAIVGTRTATTYGKEMASRLAYDLASRGFTIVSGLARGIDTMAHQGALKGGRTIAVIGSGLANVYPKENEILASSIADRGAVISEFAMETPPDRQNFPQRNRIVSKIPQGIILIEAPEKSGAMITMEKGWSQGTKLFALPGPAHSENFKGNHKLIKEDRAKLIVDADDVERAFSNLFDINDVKKKNLKSNFCLDENESQFLKQLPDEELSIEEIVMLTKLPVNKISILLMGLVLKKAMKELPGKFFKKN